MFKALIFDMDGVIIDSEHIHYRFYAEYCKRKYGFLLSLEEFNTFVGMTIKDIWATLKERYCLDKSVEELVENECKEYVHYLAAQRNEKPIEGVEELIKESFEKNIPLAIASSSAPKIIDVVLKMFNIGHFFKEKISGFEVPNGKPAPDIFLYTAQKLKVRPEDCVVIEDSKNGVRAAKAANMKCIGFRNPNSGNQDLSLADIVVSSMCEINEKILHSL